MKWFNKNFIFLLLLFTLTQVVSAQHVPGYLGKKGFIDYNFTSPYPLYAGKGYSNVIHNFRFNYIIRRRAQIGISFESFSTEGRPISTVSRFPRVYSEISGNSIGVNYDWYNKKSIAPIGRYFRVEAKYIFGNYKDDITDFGSERIEEDNFGLPYLGFGYGVRRIFYDRIVFNVGGSLGVIRGMNSEVDYRGVIGYTYFVGMHVGVGALLF